MQMNDIERGIRSMSIFSYPGEKRQDCHEYDICRINPCFNSIITADSLFSSTFTSPCTSSLFGDSIGMESCVDVLKEEDAAGYFHHRNGLSATATPRSHIGGHTRDRRSLSADFPPPIPSLARTENLHPRMPWVLRRHYTGDGRLVLTAARADRHEYFLANRSNGRLVLHLVPMDRPAANADHADGNVDHEPEEENEHYSDDHDCGSSDEINGCDSTPPESCLDVSSIRTGARCLEVGVGLPAAISSVHS